MTAICISQGKKKPMKEKLSVCVISFFFVLKAVNIIAPIATKAHNF